MSKEVIQDSLVARLLPPREQFAQALLGWFAQQGRDLPWRHTRDPYAIWLSEILLQQTRVESAIPYYQRFLEAFPNVLTLAAASLDAVLKQWEGLGYYSRARNLHQAARRIVEVWAGRVPQTAEQWQTLPGIGRYTAGAIASIAFGQCVPALDGNARRVLARLLGVETPLDHRATLETLWSAAETLIARQSPGDFNQSLIELGACLCLPKKPRCHLCPLRQWCQAYKQGRQAEIPRPRKKKARPHYRIVVAVIEREGLYLLGQRPTESMLGGLWEFPGGKVQAGESEEEALCRELREEMGIDIAVGPLLATVDHAYTHFTITLRAYTCQLTAGEPQSLYHSQICWVARTDFTHYAFPGANRKFLDRL